MLFQVSYKRFLEEIRFEKIGSENKDTLEVEDLGSMFAFYLESIDRPKEFVFVVSKQEISAVQKAQLFPISKPSLRIKDSDLKKISDTLFRIENNLKTPTREKIIETQIIKDASPSN